MNDSTIREIAEQIARAEFYVQLPLYLVLLAITGIVGFLSAFAGSYARRRGEQLATKADFEALLSQLKATTAVAEQVRTEITHADWVSRERRTIKRQKLEELITAVGDVQDWQNAFRSSTLHNGPPTTAPSPMPRAHMLADLYFPELETEFRAFAVTHHDIHLAILNAHMAMLNPEVGLQGRKDALEAFSSKYSEIYPLQVKCVASLTAKAREVMVTVIGA